MARIKVCTGEGQGECRRCKMNGIWNRHWMFDLYEFDGIPGVYCWDCAKKIAKEQGIPAFIAMEGFGGEHGNNGN